MLEINNIVITSEILKLIGEIDEFKGTWIATQNLAPDRLSKLKRVATIESVGSSTRIENAKLTNSQVETIISNLDLQTFASRDEQEVAGYAYVMDMIIDRYEHINLTENHIKQLHSDLLKYSTKDQDHRGNYKNIQNDVVAFNADGESIGVILETASPFDTPYRMADLLKWYNTQSDEDTQHPLVLVGMFIVVFLEIHPFKDGNGRLSRILTTLLLLRAGYSYVPYSSMESVIEINKDSYYTALRNTQQTIHTTHQNWESWLSFFLNMMAKQKANLVSKVTEVRHLQEALPALSRSILDLATTRREITVREIEEETHANRNTIKAHLKNLTDQGYLVAVGKGRGARYTLNNQG